ncbi:MAG: hypothetical protein V1681_11280 [Candidatus Neomarinimicrobiota bacterium]
MRKSNRIYFLITLIIWLGACEFKLPTMPSLPAKWNSKLILPLIDQSYSFGDMVNNGRTGNPISADTNGYLFYLASDSTPAPINVDDNSFWIVPGTELENTLDLKKKVKLNADNTVKPISFTLKQIWDDTNNRISYGVMDNATGTAANGQEINALQLNAQLTDSFTNPIRIRLTAQNFRENPGLAIVLDSLDLAVDSLYDSLTIALDGDSLIGGTDGSPIDSLKFNIEVQVLGKLPTTASRLTQKLTVTVTLGQLQMDSFYGQVFAMGEAPASEIDRSLTGASGIEFDSAMATLKVDDLSAGFDSVYVRLSGKKIRGSATVTDTMLAMTAAEFSLDAGPVMSNLPDTVRVYVKALSIKGAYQKSSTFGSGLDVKYSLSVPLQFTLPVTITLASGKTSTYFIKDSTTRVRIMSAQQGAELDLTVENRTQMQGYLYFLIGNFDFFPFDTVGDNLPSGYVATNDTIWHFGTDTVMVKIDTLAVMNFPPALFSGSSITPGRKTQTYLADSSTISLLADSCYLKPYFKLVNPDTTMTTITSSQSIHVKGFLNLYFDAAVLNDSGQ